MTVSLCPHLWRPDWDELVCTYCGSRLYPNEDPFGPKWRPAIEPESGIELPDWLIMKAAQKRTPRKLPNH